MASTDSYQNRKPVLPGTVTISWAIGGTVYTLTDDGAGNLTGNGDGEISYYDGKVTLRPNPAPRAADGDYELEFDQWDGGTKQTDTDIPINGTLSKTLSGAVQPGSLAIRAVMLQYPTEVTTDGTGKRQVDVVIRDDGNGNLLRYGGGTNGNIVGTINYATGALTLDARTNYKYKVQEQA